VEDACYVLIFQDFHQHPGSAVLNVLQFLDVLASDPSEEGYQSSGLEETSFSASNRVKVGGV